MRRRSMEETAILVAMRAKYAGNDKVTFDDNAKIEFAEGGAWVKGWVWWEDPLMRRDLDDDFTQIRKEREEARKAEAAAMDAAPPTLAPPLFRPLATGRMANRKRILAFDLKQRVSWAIRAADAGVVHGIVHGTDSFYAANAWRFRNWVATVCAEGSIEAVHVVESNADAHRWWLPHLEKACVGAGVPLRGATAGSVKKHILGRGVATAAAVFEAVEVLGYEPDDESEAMAIALLLLAEQPAQRKGKAAA